MSDLSERLRRSGEYSEDKLEAADEIERLTADLRLRVKWQTEVADECARLQAQVEALEWLVPYIIDGLDDWSTGHINDAVFFTKSAVKRVRSLAATEQEKSDE